MYRTVLCHASLRCAVLWKAGGTRHVIVTRNAWGSSSFAMLLCCNAATFLRYILYGSSLQLVFL